MAKQKFKIKIYESRVREIEVEATDVKKALGLAKAQYNKGEISLDSQKPINPRFNVVDDIELMKERPRIFVA